MIILAIDPGAKTGWAHLDTDGRKLLRYGTASPLLLKNRAFREGHFSSCGLLAIEDQYLGVNPQSMKSVIESKCFWTVTASDLGVPIKEMQPSEWQRFIVPGWHRGIKRDKIATGVRAYLQSRFQLGQKVSQDTLCAIGIGSVICDQIAMGILKI